MINQNKIVKALLIVDLQNDFLPGGALPVSEGRDIIPVVDKLLKQPFNFKIATKDWHPFDHGSFASIYIGKKTGEVIQLEGIEQILWPVHCVQETEGAEFAKGWDSSQFDKIIHKGTDKKIDSYSGFFDNKHKKSTGLLDYLRSNNVSDLYIAGLATDYCVKFTVLDAIFLGFNVYVIENGCRGVGLNENDIPNAIHEMKELGATFITI